MAEPGFSINRINAYRIYRQYNLLRDSLSFLKNTLELKLKKNIPLSPLERTLLGKINQLPNYTFEQIRRLSSDKLSDFLVKIEDLNRSLKEFQSRGKKSLPQQKLAEARETLQRLKSFVSKIIDKRSVPASRPQRHIPLPHDKNIRNHVLMEPANSKPKQPSRPQSLRIHTPHRTIEMIASLKKSRSSDRIPLDNYVRAAVEDSSIKSSRLSSRLLGYLLIALFLKKVIDRMPQRKTSQIVDRAIEKALKELNSQLGFSKFDPKTQVKPRSRKADPDAREKSNEMPKPVFSVEAQKSSGSGRVIYRLKYDSKGNIVGIEILGKLKESEVIATSKRVLNSEPREMVPLLTAAAVETVRNNPKATFEVLDYISQTVSNTPAAAQIDPAVNPSLSIPKAMETILGETVHALLDPDRISDIKIEPAARLEIATRVLQKYHQAALPVLIKEFNRLPSSARQAVSAIADKLVQSKEVQQQILKVFSEGSRHELVSSLAASELGQKIIVQTAQALLEKAKAKTGKTANADKLAARIVSQIVLVNPTKFPSTGLSFKTAREFLEVVSKARECFDLVRAKKPRSRKPAKARTNYYPNRYRSSLRQKGKVKLPPKKLVQLTKAAQELNRLSKESNLILPDKLVKEFQAGLAGLNLTVAPQPVQASIPLPEKSAQATSMERILQALEAQAKQGEKISSAEKAPQLNPLEAIKSVTEEAHKTALDGSKLLHTIIKRLVWDPTLTPAEIKQKMTEYVKKLRESANRYQRVIAALEGVDPHGAEATAPIYYVENLLRSRKYREREDQAGSEEERPAEAQKPRESTLAAA